MIQVPRDSSLGPPDLARNDIIPIISALAIVVRDGYSIYKKVLLISLLLLALLLTFLLALLLPLLLFLCHAGLRSVR